LLFDLRFVSIDNLISVVTNYGVAADNYFPSPLIFSMEKVNNKRLHLHFLNTASWLIRGQLTKEVNGHRKRPVDLTTW